MVLFAIILSAIIAAAIAVFIGLYVNNRRYVTFVNENSLALKTLYKINSEYKFFPYENYDKSHKYDNQKYYESISCEDFLTYCLQFSAKKTKEQIEKINFNRAEYKKYSDRFNSIPLGQFSAPTGKLNEKKLLYTEKQLYSKIKLAQPATQFTITVTLYCSTMHGNIYDFKKATFTADDIITLIRRLNNRNGYYYRDTGIWNAICRVERGNVSNKMRFSVYARDGYRCRICGISQRYAALEIDHIIPIAKGGKSTYDNLQTLCHRCNVEKSDKIYKSQITDSGRR